MGKEKKLLDGVVLTLNTLESELADNSELFEMSKEDGDEAGLLTIEAEADKLQAIIKDLEFRRMFNNPADPLPCFLDIQAGAGGTEACDWASMLLRQYLKYAERKGFKTTIEDETAGDTAGIKGATIKIEGEYAFGLLRTETGVHRLVRISPFNAQGKRQTSFSSVFVYPLIENDEIEIVVKEDDIRWDVFRASGAGGQHVNRTESAVRVTHIPTGLVAECQVDRSQIQNRARAMQLLKSRLYELELRKRQAEKDKIEAGKSKIEWGSQIRSYVLDDRWVKDLRSGYKVHNPDAVLNGDLNEFFKAYLMWERNPTGVVEDED